MGIAPTSLSWGFVLAGIALAVPAAAQTATPVDAAAPPAEDDGTRSRDPRDLFASGSFSEAYEAFASSHAKSPDPRALWNMAACQKNLGRYAKTRAALRAYATSPGLATRERKEAEGLIEKLAPLVSTLRVTVSEPGAEVVIDGDSLGVSPLAPAELDVGTHEVLVRKAGFQDLQRSVRVARDAESTVDAHLVKATDAVWRAPLVQQTPQAQPWRMDRGSSFTLDLTGGSRTPHAGSVSPSKPATGRSSSMGPVGAAVVGLAAAAAIYRLARGDGSRDRASSGADHAAVDARGSAETGDDRVTNAPGLGALDVLK